ncbi:MAG: bifunctional phosphoglucose/phosphomannose isomerase, partial [Candidatus Aenigmatarchaeota archaeon]
IEKSLYEFPEMMKKALKKEVDFIIEKKLKNIVIVGMGGSAISGDVLIDLIKDKIEIPIEVCRYYELPNFVKEDSLVILISYSGNTEETISCFKQAIKKKAKIVCITSNGILENLCKKYKIPLIKIPPKLKPRAAFPFLFISLLKIIDSFKKELMILEGIEEAIEIIEKIREENFDKKKKELKQEGMLYEIAKLFYKKDAILIYSSEHLKGVATRIKTQINENSKMLSWFSLLPELNHNEISGWQEVKKSNFAVIFLRTKDENERIIKRIEYTEDILKNRAIIKEIWSIGENKLAKLFSLIYRGDIISLHLGKMRNVNVDEVPLQDRIKEILRK